MFRWAILSQPVWWKYGMSWRKYSRTTVPMMLCCSQCYVNCMQFSGAYINMVPVRVNLSIIYTCLLLQDRRGLVPITRGHWVRGGVYPGQVTSPSNFSLNQNLLTFLYTRCVWNTDSFYIEASCCRRYTSWPPMFVNDFQKMLCIAGSEENKNISQMCK